MRFEGRSGSRVGNGNGSGGLCVCVDCNIEVRHKSGVPCFQMKCPECGSAMERDENVIRTSSSPSTFREPQVNIDLDLCVGCKKCVPACPFNAIRMVNYKAVVDDSICKGCMKCISACPTGAISRP